MKRTYLVCLFLCLTTTSLLSQSSFIPAPISASQGDPKAQTKILDSYGKLPLSFEANHGQTDASVKFLSRTNGYSLFLTGDEAVFALSGKKADSHKPKIDRVDHPLPSDMAATKAGGVLRMKLRNANPTAKVTGLDELAGTSNYFIGNDPAKWRTNVPTYAKVKYEGIYSGIDLVYYGSQRQLEYDFIVAPGANPHGIQFDVRGAKRIRRDAQGDLVLKMGDGDGEIRWHKPVVYQEKDGERQLIAVRYVITDRNRVAFELAKYDATRPLYIDPLIYSTYLGGSDGDRGFSIAVDSAGNAYVTGATHSLNFPVTPGAFQTTLSCCGAFVTKFNPADSALVYSTYLGDSGQVGFTIAVDSAGNAYVTGATSSLNFPVTPGAFQTTYGGGNVDAFVTEINPTGSALVYSTYLGGSSYDGGYGIAVDSAGNAYVIGWTSSTNFPTMNPLQPTYGGGTYDAFLAKINPSGSALVYSTYLGGSGDDEGQGIAVDSAGNAYVTGGAGADFPTTPGAFQTTGSGAFVTKLNPSGSALAYSTYLDGGGSNAIAVDSAGNAYVTGATSSVNFPVTPGAFQTTYGGGFGDAFVTKINSTGSALVYSTYLGGSSFDHGTGIAVDNAGNAYVVGLTGSHNLPTESALQPHYRGGDSDAFVAKINPSGSALFFSTYLGGNGWDEGRGIAVDSAGNAYVTGYTESSNFPTTSGAFQRVCNDGSGCSVQLGDAFVTKIQMLTVTTTALTSSPNPSTYGQSATFAAAVTSKLGAPPDGETVTFKKGTTVLGTGTLNSGSASFTTSTLKVGTNLVNAVYGGDSNFASSTSKGVSQVVSKATTTTALASSLNPSNFGQSVTFTASVTPQFSGTVTGTMTFCDGTTALKTVSLSGGVAKFTTSTLASGTHSITAVYGGNSNFSGSASAPVNQVVLVATTTTLSSFPNPSAYGQAVAFTAEVISTLGAPPPDGEIISFMKGTTVLGTGTLSGGSASFMTSTLPVGTNVIKAVYGGDLNLPGSTSKAVSQVVSKATTTTALTSSLNPSNVGQSVTFTASVTPQLSGTVTGPVTFYDGTTALKTVSLSGEVAKFTTSTLASGTHTITATYNGSTSFIGSSASLTQTVN